MLWYISLFTLICIAFSYAYRGLREALAPLPSKKIGVQEREKNDTFNPPDLKTYRRLCSSTCTSYFLKALMFVVLFILCKYFVRMKERTSISCQMHYYHQSLHLTSYKVPKFVTFFSFKIWRKIYSRRMQENTSSSYFPFSYLIIYVFYIIKYWFNDIQVYFFCHQCN